jgi:phage terminase large subunit-like protein
MKSAPRFKASSLASLPPGQQERWLASLTADELVALEHDWPFWARDDQLPPTGLWRVWLALCGRGWGKTRVGAQWVLGVAGEGKVRIALIGRTAADVRGTMVEGESGILASSPPWFRPKWEPSYGDAGRLVWPNGALAIGYSAETPQALRGPQHHAGWLDELAAWRRMRDAWDMYRFGLRLGQQPRTCITTTPTPAKLIKELVADDRKAPDGQRLVRVIRGSTYANAANLADDFLAELRAKYEGTRLGRQELDGEILVDKPGALWTLSRIEEHRPTGLLPAMQRIVVAIDPPISSQEGADECGIIVAGLGADGHGYILADESERGLDPRQWAEKAAAAYHAHGADRIVAEANQGGEMVSTVIRQVDGNLPVKLVHATRAKYVRAEPVSALYAQGRVHHGGVFKVLEDQLCDFTPDFDRSKAGYSPDRLDALVWALTELMITGTAGEARIRRL